eukprot:scaffold208548_cov34-Prasinocladus_malaysianus.AAC.1
MGSPLRLNVSMAANEMDHREENHPAILNLSICKAHCTPFLARLTFVHFAILSKATSSKCVWMWGLPVKTFGLTWQQTF